MPGREEVVSKVNKVLAEGKMTVEMAKEYETAILNFVTERKRVILQGFGTFEVRDQDARMARDPRNNTPVKVPAKSKMVFRSGGDGTKLNKLKGFVKKPKK